MKVLIILAKVILTFSMLYGIATAAFLGLLGIQGDGSSVIVATAIGLLLLSMVQIRATWSYREKWATRWNIAWLIIYSILLVMVLITKDTTPISGLLIGIIPLALLVWQAVKSKQ